MSSHYAQYDDDHAVIYTAAHVARISKSLKAKYGRGRGRGYSAGYECGDGYGYGRGQGQCYGAGDASWSAYGWGLAGGAGNGIDDPDGTVDAGDDYFDHDFEYAYDDIDDDAE